MAINYEGNDYVVQTPTDNAYDILNYINEKMVEFDIRNKAGEVVQFTISLASPIWLIIFGVGFMASVLQKIMYAVGQAFSIADCSEQQLLNLAQIAGLRRGQGGYSTVVLRVTATETGNCTVTNENTVTITYEGKTVDVSITVNPLPKYTVTFMANESEKIKDEYKEIFL